MGRVKKWKKIGRQKMIFEKYGKYVIRQDFELPANKKKINFYFVGEGDSVVIFPLDKGGRVIISRQYRPGIDEITDELPAGNIDGKETPKSTILRELLEETGYKPSRIVYLGWFSMSNSNSFSKLHCFLGLNCVKVAGQKLAECEDVEVVLASQRQWLEKIFKNKITSPASIVNTFLALPYLNSGLIKKIWKKD